MATRTALVLVTGQIQQLQAGDTIAGVGGTLGVSYASGTVAADQTLSLLDTHGGGFVVDGTSVSFTGTYALQVKGAASSLVNFPTVGGLAIVAGAVPAATPKALAVTAGGHTAMTAGTEDIDYLFDGSATKTWAAGAIATQRDFVVKARTYAFASASTVTTAATLAIENPPQAGTNATITNPLALWVQAGVARFDGAAYFQDGSQSSPGIAFKNATGAGMYHIGTGNSDSVLLVCNNGTPRFTIGQYGVAIGSSQSDIVTFSCRISATAIQTPYTLGLGTDPSSPWIGASMTSNSWTGVASNGTIFVAVAQSGSASFVATSTTGSVWTSRTPAAALAWQSVCWGNGLFVAVASSGTGNRVMTSPDGITWTSRTSAADISWKSVCYGGGLFVAVSNTTTANNVMTSPDGITWTLRTGANTNTWESVCYGIYGGSGLYVAVSDTGAGAQTMQSSDGVTWTGFAAASAVNWFGVAWSAAVGLFVAVATQGANRVMTSPDGITWTGRMAAINSGWNAITWGAGKFIAVSNSSSTPLAQIMSSVDGINWYIQTNVVNTNLVSVAYNSGQNRFVAVTTSGSNGCIYSTQSNALLQNAGDSYLAGGLRLGARILSGAGPYSVLSPGPVGSDCILQVTQAAANTINLPPISTVQGGWIIPIVDSRYTADANPITITPGNATDKINNGAAGANYLISQRGQSLFLVANGTTNNWEFMAYLPPSGVGGIAEMWEYNNAISLGIDAQNVYHPLWTSGLVVGTLDGWTFLAGASGSFTSVTNPGGGQITFAGATGHGMVAGQLVHITSSSVSAYQAAYIIQSVTTNTFTVTATFSATATGTWARGTSLTAGASAAGQYQLNYAFTLQPTSGSNKNYKIEAAQNTAGGLNKGSNQANLQSTGPSCISGSSFLTIVAGDIIVMTVMNMTDTTDLTVISGDCRLFRYSR